MKGRRWMEVHLTMGKEEGSPSSHTETETAIMTPQRYETMGRQRSSPWG